MKNQIIKPENLELGNRISDTVSKKGINKTKLAEHVGISYQQLDNYIKGVNRPPEDKLKKIAEFLSIDHIWLSYGSTFSPYANFNGDRPWVAYYTDFSFGGGKTSFNELEIIGKVIVHSQERIDYAAKINGASMEPEIRNGSLLFIQKVPPGIIRNRDIAICCCPYSEGEKDWMVRRVFFHERTNYSEIILQPNNGEPESYVYSKGEIVCFGKVIAWEEDEEEIEKILIKLQPVTKLQE